MMGGVQLPGHAVGCDGRHTRRQYCNVLEGKVKPPETPSPTSARADEEEHPTDAETLQNAGCVISAMTLQFGTAAVMVLPVFGALVLASRLLARRRR